MTPVVVKTKAQPLATVRAPMWDFDITQLQLRGDKGDKILLNALLTEATYEGTIEGASTVTITVHDFNRTLARSALIKTAATLVLDNVTYTLVKVARDGNQLTLTLEETAVNVLRRYDKPRKANRDNTTRAQFVRALVKEPTEYVIPFRCPEADARQPVASAT